MGRGNAPAQVNRRQDVAGIDRVFKAASNGILGQPSQQIRHVVIGAAAGEIVVDLESGRSHGLHGLGLVEDVLKGRQVEFEPSVALGGVGLHGLGHVTGGARHGPTAHRHPRAVLLPEELVHRHAPRFDPSNRTWPCPARWKLRHPSTRRGCCPHTGRLLPAAPCGRSRLGRLDRVSV